MRWPWTTQPSDSTSSSSQTPRPMARIALSPNLPSAGCGCTGRRCVVARLRRKTQGCVWRGGSSSRSPTPTACTRPVRSSGCWHPLSTSGSAAFAASCNTPIQMSKVPARAKACTGATSNFSSAERACSAPRWAPMGRYTRSGASYSSNCAATLSATLSRLWVYGGAAFASRTSQRPLPPNTAALALATSSAAAAALSRARSTGCGPRPACSIRSRTFFLPFRCFPTSCFAGSCRCGCW